MNKNIYTFCLFISVCGLFPCIAQPLPKKYIDAYNLHFSMEDKTSVEYPWMENAAYTGCAINYMVKELDRTLFTKKYLKGFPCGHLRTELEQRVLLPIHKEKRGLVTFEGKGENIKVVSIIVDGINDKEKCVFSDTVSFVPGDSLSSISKRILLDGVNMLNIRIRAEGAADREAYIAFSKLDIMVGNKNINEYSVRDFPKLSLPKGFDYIPFRLNEENLSSNIEVMKDRRIIAFGESVHGNNSIRHLVYKLMMESVENQDCKLVIWEMPMEKSLVYNRYVLDDEFVLDSTELSPLDEQRIIFMNGVKRYNSGKREGDKIRLLGMDYNSVCNSAQNSAIDIFDFVTHLNREWKIPEVDRLSVLLMEKDWKDAIEYLQTHKSNLQKILTIDEIECITHILSLSNNIGGDRVKRFINRDSVMFVNTNFLLDHFSSFSKNRTIIYAHSVHVNPVSTYPVVHCEPFGKYMKDKYADDYLPLLLLIGNGSMTIYDQEFNRGKEVLQRPPAESIESALNQIESDIFYFPMTSYFDTIVLSRFQGDRKSPREFYPYNLYQRYRGIFFIKNSFEPDDNGEKMSAFDKAERVLMRNKQRLKILEDIKKRLKIIS